MKERLTSITFLLFSWVILPSIIFFSICIKHESLKAKIGKWRVKRFIGSATDVAAFLKCLQSRSVLKETLILVIDILVKHGQVALQCIWKKNLLRISFCCFCVSRNMTQCTWQQIEDKIDLLLQNELYFIEIIYNCKILVLRKS